MDFDDIIYIALLLLSIGFGHIYRQIKDKEEKKWVGTGVGLLVVLIVSGTYIWHVFLIVAVNSLIILCVSKRSCHLVSFAFSFIYLMFFRTTIYFGIPYPPSHTNLIQMVLTLKLVGLAFEVNDAYMRKKKKDAASKTDEEKLEDESNEINPNLIDIFHYSFNYIGVLTGPYYRYRTFADSFNLPFSDYAPCNDATIKKITYVPLYAVLFLVASSIWPLSYALSDEFYNERSFLYRFWYVWPNFFIFRMRLYTGLVLSECVCTMAGLGAYPTISVTKPGLGPSTNFRELKEIAADPERLKSETYDFETINNINPYTTELCPTMREGIKNWNICIQYWLAVNIYKRFPKKSLRTFATFFVSAVWHGVYLGHYICICGAVLYLPVEAIYTKLFLKDNKGPSLAIWQWMIWIFKMQAFSYLGIAFNLLTVHSVTHYYNSVYHIGLIADVILYVVGLQLLKEQTPQNRRSDLSSNVTNGDDENLLRKNS